MPGDRPQVTVLTLTHNHAPYLAECIGSVIAQTFSDWELVILDDGSTDRTEEIARSSNDPRVRYLRQDQLGPERLAESYNRLLSEARGRLLGILEGDDLWPEDKLERQVPDFDDPGVVLSAGRFRTVGESGELGDVFPLELPPREALDNDPVGRASVAMLRHNVMTFTFPVSVVVRRSALDAIGGFHSAPDLPLVDYPTFLRLGLEGRWRFHDRVTGLWRRHEGSVTRSRYPWILSAAHSHAAAFAREFGHRLPFLEGERDSIARAWNYFEVERLGILGRWMANERSWTIARSLFRRALEFPVGAKSKALFRLADRMAAMRLSPDAAFALAGRRDWREALSERSGERLVSLEMRPQDFAPQAF